MDDFLSLFDAPWVAICFGIFFIVLGWWRGLRRPVGSLSAGTGGQMFGVVGAIMLVSGLIEMFMGR